MAYYTTPNYSSLCHTALNYIAHNYTTLYYTISYCTTLLYGKKSSKKNNRLCCERMSFYDRD